MPLADSQQAIGAVSELLRGRLSARMGNLDVAVGRVEAAAAGNGSRLNLFLYRVGFDPSLRNVTLDPGQPAPLWTVLHYLVTAFDVGRDSDSIDAHRLLGRALAALHELNYVRPGALDTALQPNPEPLKISFDEADVELLSKLMQGSEEKYRVSAAFQIRPVLIAPGTAPAYALLVRHVGPPTAPGVAVLPSLGARLEAVQPERFEVGATLTLRGQDLAGYTEIWIGPVVFPATVAGEGRLTTVVPAATALPAGAHAAAVARLLPSGRRITSNAVLARLAPTITAVALGALAPAGGGMLHGTLAVTGTRLGGPRDSVIAAFYRDGVVKLMLEASGLDPQTSLTLTVAPSLALLPGPYRLILRVNGEQATESPEVQWV